VTCRGDDGRPSPTRGVCKEDAVVSSSSRWACAAAVAVVTIILRLCIMRISSVRSDSSDSRSAELMVSMAPAIARHRGKADGQQVAVLASHVHVSSIV
jgi:hypothetical protein